MEPDVIRIYSSSPPPMEDGGEEDDGEFSDFTGVPNSTSFSEFDTPATLNQSQVLNATSPPELLSNGRIVGLSLVKANGVVPSASQTGMPNGRTTSTEELKNITGHQAHGLPTELALGSRTDTGCNGGVQVLTNGFSSSAQGESPPLLHKNIEPEDDFADFSAFSNAEHNTTSNTDCELPLQECRLPQNDVNDGVDDIGEEKQDLHNTGFGFLSETSASLRNGDLGFHEGTVFDHCGQEAEATAQSLALNGAAQTDIDDTTASPDSNDERCSAAQSEVEETETETSFGRPLSTEALEEFGDFSTTGSMPSPPLQEETSTPADHSQIAEDDDEDFGDFGDASSFSSTGFADFDQQGARQETSQEESASVSAVNSKDNEFGDFDASKNISKVNLSGQEETSTDFPASDSFADFSSAQEDGGGDSGGWRAFPEPDQSQNGGDSWAKFGDCAEKDRGDLQESHQVSAPPAVVVESRSSTMSALLSRLEKIFQTSFELVLVPQEGKEVNTLHTFIKATEHSEEDDREKAMPSRMPRGVWQHLQDVHDAHGLRYQWGGSYTNKALLCSLGIDTRNILFTGQKKQPVIVPMYAAGLGMLEPTKEPVKPLSAAEMIASIAQSPSASAELSAGPSDSNQFDWSSSGLTNPLDASGGSSLLNLDFFGPVDESPTGTATSIPGVDPELYELTQVKLEVSSGRVADAFARLMSTAEKNSTSTRKPVLSEEHLSDEAQLVISGLPDLSFMKAKVLMFPCTLTPLPPSSSD
ncbi:hypothetical protein DNTS_030163 [Danionella cerebrum]|uniref:Aftiphilin clathrin-binding box domain-containing protein n=1 Tax=Danionella cerebrum TaxID=2873325 RepID=A0A553Q807_9TELE|nr:hypothetical protein DNTS_030163 [Danionella translucida]